MTIKLRVRTLRSIAKSARDFYLRHQQVASWKARGVFISPEAYLLLDAGSQVEIGEGASIGRHTILNVRAHAKDADHRSSVLRIGARTAILEMNNIRAGGGRIVIGDDCLISQYVTIVATNHLVDSEVPARHAPWDYSKPWVEIGNGVWIGAGASVMPGVRIGTASIVSAGAVVTHDVPDGAIVGGVPARLLRYRTASAEKARG